MVDLDFEGNNIWRVIRGYYTYPVGSSTIKTVETTHHRWPMGMNIPEWVVDKWPRFTTLDRDYQSLKPIVAHICPPINSIQTGTLSTWLGWFCIQNHGKSIWYVCSINIQNIQTLLVLRWINLFILLCLIVGLDSWDPRKMKGIVT